MECGICGICGIQRAPGDEVKSKTNQNMYHRGCSCVCWGVLYSVLCGVCPIWYVLCVEVSTSYTRAEVESKSDGETYFNDDD